MICSEAVEFMHRYIDHDLNEEEKSILFEHMRNCRDCTEEFDLLNELSHKLEDLPKVTPRFSLVDAIMPQLDEIDRARNEGSAALDAPATMVPVRASSELSRSQRRERPSRNRKRIYRTGALGLAAVVILAVFINNYEPKTVSDAEIQSYAYDNGQASNDESGTTSNTFSESIDAGNKLADQAGNGNNNADIYLKEKDSDPLADQKVDPPSGSEAGDVKAASPDDEPKANATPVEQGGNAAPPMEQQLPTKVQQDAPVKEGNGQSGNSLFPQEKYSEDEMLEPRAVNNNSDMRQLEEQPAPISTSPEESNMMGISNFTAEQRWNSPDGTYTAELVDEQLHIYRNDANDRTLLIHVSVEGSWVKGEWSKDSTTFTYETEKDGAQAAHIVQP